MAKAGKPTDGRPRDKIKVTEFAPTVTFSFKEKPSKAYKGTRAVANSKGKPCSTERAGCPVQLVWKKGDPHLRFCSQKNRPGHLLPVKDVRDAVKVSGDMCRCWEKTGSMSRCIITEERRAGRKSSLGGVRRKRKAAARKPARRRRRARRR